MALRRQNGRKMNRIKHKHTKESLTQLLQTFDADTLSCTTTLNGIVAAIDRVQTVCSSVIEETAQLRTIHRNANSVYKKLADLEKFENAPRNIDAILLVSIPGAHETLDIAVDDLLKAEHFVSSVRCPLPLAQRTALSSKIMQSKENAAQWYTKQWAIACNTSAVDINANINTQCNSNIENTILSSPSISRILVELNCEELCKSTYISVRAPVVKAKYQELCDTTTNNNKNKNKTSTSISSSTNNNLKTSNNDTTNNNSSSNNSNNSNSNSHHTATTTTLNTPSLTSLIQSLETIIHEEADFLSKTFGSVDNNGLGIDSNVSTTCFDEIIQECATTQVRAALDQILHQYTIISTQSIEDRIQYDSIKIMESLEELNVELLCLQNNNNNNNNNNNSSSNNNSSKTSSTTCSNGNNKQINISSNLIDGVHCLFHAIEEEGIVELCSAAVAADHVIENIRSELLGSVISQKSFDIIRKELDYVRSMSRKWVQYVFHMMARPDFLAVATHVYHNEKYYPNIQFGINAITKLSITFAVNLIHHQDINIVLLEDITPKNLTTNKYALLIMASLGTALESSLVQRVGISPIHTYFDNCSTSMILDEPKKFKKSIKIHVFKCINIINNIQYMKEHVKDIDDDGRYIKSLDQSIACLLQEYFVPLFTNVFVTQTLTPILNEPKDLNKSIPSTSVFCRTLKERFTLINNHLDEWKDEWLTLIVDKKVQSTIRQCMIDLVQDCFEPFYRKYSKIQFSKKNMVTYTRWDPKKIVKLLSKKN